ncbi:vacuolar protein sorting-associated protein 35-domain-containing protein, partial [Pisolithus albus]
KESHQATTAATHLWWQEPPAEGDGALMDDERSESPKDGEAGVVRIFFPHQESKRILRCPQKALRIANSATEEIMTVQSYCETLDQYLYYFDHGAPAIAPKYIVLLVEPIPSSIDAISSPAFSTSYLHPSRRIEGGASLEMVARHSHSALSYYMPRRRPTILSRSVRQS